MKIYLTIVLVLLAMAASKTDFFQGLFNIFQELIAVAKSGTLDGVHPEALMTTLELVKYYGYIGEKHHVVTHDGYILEIHRIPFGKRNSTKYRRPPVLLQHGNLARSTTWLLNKEESLAFLLADEGYDVWLGNLRGNSYGRSHVKLSPEDPKFWNYNLDDHAHSDLPAVIDYILQITGFDKLTYTGLSLGGTIGALLLAGSPEYNDKVKLAVLLAPVAYGRFVKNPLRVIGNHIKEFSEWYAALGTKEMRLKTPLAEKFILSVCTDYPGVILCEAILSVIGGYNERLLDLERAHVFVVHLTDVTSLDIIRHFAMMYQSDKIVYFDYGTEGNSRKYGQVLPPVYDMSKITSPTAIFYGYMDLYVDQRDIERLASEITGLKLLERVPYDSWTHGDFVFAKNAKKYSYDRLIDVINSVH